MSHLDYESFQPNRYPTKGERFGTAALGGSVGGLIGFVLLGCAAVGASAGHGSYGGLVLFFPFAMSITHWTEHIGSPVVCIAMVQFPIYGAVAGAYARTRRFGAALAALFLVHVIGLSFGGALTADAFR